MYISIKKGHIVIEDFRKKGEVVAWIGFKFDGHNPPQNEFIDNLYEKYNDPQIGIFGPIFYSTREAFGKALKYIKTLPTSHKEMAWFERVIPIAFKMAGYESKYMEEYSNDRIDIKRDYIYFDKFRPGRA